MSHQSGPWPPAMPLRTHGQAQNLAYYTQNAIGDSQIGARANPNAVNPCDPAPSSTRESEDEAEPNRLHQESRIRHRPPMMVDWRRELCRFLETPNESTDDDILEKLEETSKLLREAEHLKLLAFAQQGPPKFQVINRIECHNFDEHGIYLDMPWVVESGPYQAHLRCSSLIPNLDLHLERNKDVTCIVYRNFACCGTSSSRASRSQTYGVDPSSLLVEEYVCIVSDELKTALTQLAEVALQGIPHPDFMGDESQRIPYPYLWWFHRRPNIELSKSQLDPTIQQHVEVFQGYVEDCLGDTWAAVDALLANGKITAQYMDYLFVPNEIVLSRSNSSSVAQLEAFTPTDWLEGLNTDSQPAPSTQLYPSISVNHWVFDGNFQQESTILMIGQPPSMTEEFPIDQLLVYPMKYATHEVAAALRERGKMFWKCRHRNFIYFSGAVKDSIYNAHAGSRFIIDTATHRLLHPPAQGLVPPSRYRDDIGPQLMAQDDPPSELNDTFYMCLPTTMYGFHMLKKTWLTLSVGYFQDVIWNKEAFDLLVIDDITKELVEAVVTNHVHAEKNADVIHGKGNGLLILLHGGPGTGKTLTAESVAEIAKKPLYRVTCGDIGTKAEAVEEYLQVVFLLGKKWGCIVLLDEADVFLEQRSLHSLDRNALVSVFLRALEYYDGILILTSNRVGTFDEAFMSRIQLNLRYKNLVQDQRRQIWENFINRLEKPEPEQNAETDTGCLVADGPQPNTNLGVDTQSMRDQLDKLAEPPLNGREIRNLISTARQLAMFRKKKMGYEHLKAVMMEGDKFNAYLKDLRKGFSADEIKNHRGDR
ncbi:ATPase [Dactylonectria macrodidyma]|uniref:ATPase n=1 Tax=Dactylonectria macrodidyma TaxID=307937 RepID=A0A9P9DUP2_9HYPO|nr:ATPase [Dactylonectria macrodidyma]